MREKKSKNPGRTDRRVFYCCRIALALLILGAFMSSCAQHHAMIRPIHYQASGNASWYGPGFAGRKTASGERFNPKALTAAHKTLPIGTTVKVTHVENGKSVVVRINDRGPFVGGRIIDLSRAAAQEIGMLGAGTAPVEVVALSAPGEKIESFAEEKSITKRTNFKKTSVEVKSKSSKKNQKSEF